MEQTLCICKACDKPFINEETEQFIYQLDLPKFARETAHDHMGELCVYCMRDQITKETGIVFVTVYEIQLQEKIMIWEENENADKI